MCSNSSRASQPQLLTPKFFEPPPKLLPPSAFRQPATAAVKHQLHRPSSPTNSDHSDSKVAYSTCGRFTAEHNPAGAAAGGTLSMLPPSESLVEPTRSEASKETATLCSESDCDKDTFNPKCDNQLLLLAENVCYSLAAKQRWKNSAVESRTKLKLDEVTSATPRPIKGQTDTPTLLTRGIRVPSCSQTVAPALSRTVNPSTVVGVNEPLTTHSVALFPSPAFSRVKDRPLVSAAPHSISVAPVDSEKSYWNNFDKVLDHTGPSKSRTTDNLKLSHSESQPIELDTNAKKISQRLDHRESVSLAQTHLKEPSHSFERSTSATFGQRMASASADTDSDCVLAQMLQNDEYGQAINGMPDQYLEREVKAKPKSGVNCSNDFEIARRLQLQVDAEMAHSMQRQEDHCGRARSGSGRRLGTRSDGSDAIHETGHGYYDNNNQYRYEKIREDGVECPDVLAGHRRGGGGFPMRSMSSSRRYRSVGATAAVASVSGGEMDMSYEALVELEDVSRGLDKDTISRLSNIYQYYPTSSGSVDKSCSVCLCEFESGEVLRSLPCIHVFHKNCIDQWLMDNRHCPVCMKDIDSIIT